MKKRKWYRRKRIYLGTVLFIWLAFVQTEMAKLRYVPEQLAARIGKSIERPIRFREVAVAGRTLHYVQIGETDTLPSIVMVHGSPGALNAYDHYLADSLLNRHANLIAVDRPGFGYSDFGQTEASLKIQAQLIAAVLETLPATPKVLIGHSMGGPVIAKLAMDYPQLVDGLVLVAPSISPSLEPSNGWRRFLNIIPLRWFTPPALRVCNQEIIPLKKELEGMMDGWAKLHIPVTVIQGTEDQLVPEGNADFAKTVLTSSPEVKLQMIENGNHFILWSEVPLIIEELLALLLIIKA